MKSCRRFYFDPWRPPPIKGYRPLSICLPAITHFLLALACSVIVPHYASVIRHMMKREHRCSCKHVDVIWAPCYLSHSLTPSKVRISACSVCIERGVNLRGETSHNLLNNNWREQTAWSLRSCFSPAAEGELLIERECELHRLLIWPRLETHTQACTHT